MKKEKTGGSICGGVVSESKFKKNPWAYLMAYTMPDIRYNQYIILKKLGKEKEAQKLFNRYAYSHI